MTDTSVSVDSPIVPVVEVRPCDWYDSLGISHEQWWANLLAEGWEPEYPDWTEGSLIELNGRMVQRHSVRRWVPGPFDVEAVWLAALE